MNQRFKTVYFSDMPGETAKQKSLTLAFGKKADNLHDSVKDLSSAELRQLLGTDSYQDLVASAQTNGLPVNTYCLRRLRESVNLIKERQAQLVLSGVNIHSQLFDPLTVTFRGGAKEPFIRWYPYIQGYSPDFVKAILDRYAPRAQRVLDPFSGTGTPIFTASELSLQAYYSEINPVLQFITLTKVRVRQLAPDQRLELAQQLVGVCGTLDMLDNFPPDPALHQAYSHTFGDSTFYDQPTYEQVLRIRSWIDEVALEHPTLADLITVATLAALVPASRMKRAGDLRYKTAEEAKRQTIELDTAIRRNIIQMARDIRDDVDGLGIEPILVCENARCLGRLPHMGIDTVITSPPYVNGTNYFRNTKIELWFLRCLTEPADLARFRAAALTAGINDVTVAKTPSFSHPEVQRVVSVLEQVAYDSRIPRMIASYFAEITDTFHGVATHLLPEATVAVDIGDSAYVGVHVPVDELLIACLQDIGFVVEDNVTLRQRKSRGGTLLKQSLLVFRYLPGQAPFYVKQLILPWRPAWDDFKRQLPHQQKPFTKRNWGHAWHSLCSYPGKLKPAIAHHLVQAFVPEQGSVLDPFAGVGTIPLEAALNGKQAYGFEISPAALAIASAKTHRPSKAGCESVCERLQRFIERHVPTEEEMAEVNEFGFNGRIAEYFEHQTLREVILARRYFQVHRPEMPEDLFVLASLLHILHGNRPYALSRRSHPITPYKPTGPFEYRPLVGRLRDKVQRSLQQPLPAEFRPGKMFLRDATTWWPREIDRIDAVISSPPFFDSTRFYLANWLRLWFSGWTPQDFKTRPLGFVDERQKSGFEVYIPIFRQARERLKSDGVVVLHLGKSAKCDMAAHLKELGKRWFRSADVFEESVAHCESHGIRDKGTVTSHQYLVLN